VTVALLALALVVSVLVMPVWGWSMLAVAPLYLDVHRGELGQRVAGDSRPARRLPWKSGAPAPASTAPRAAATCADSGIAILDRELRVTWCNPTGSAQLGLHQGCLARTALNCLAPDSHALPALAGEEQTLIRTVDGRSLALQWLPFVHGSWLLVSRDVTGQEEAGVHERHLVADASHELRTPLTVMIGLLETVTELDLDRERSAYYFDLMAQQGRRMQSIVEGLLKLSKLEALPASARAERVDMGGLLARIQAEAEVLSGGRHAITREADAADLLGAETEISSAVANLVSNAVRYTLAGGEIRIVWRLENEGATLIVQDTGIGIDPQHVPLLTRRFYRVEDSRDVSGTGLGLSIVQLVLERHEARLDIQSAPGMGSTFAARFPAHRVIVSPAAAGRLNACETP
jgi:two-component system phosphate regulon sensor histidine kinase PhoR